MRAAPRSKRRRRPTAATAAATAGRGRAATSARGRVPGGGLAFENLAQPPDRPVRPLRQQDPALRAGLDLEPQLDVAGERLVGDPHARDLAGDVEQALGLGDQRAALILLQEGERVEEPLRGIDALLETRKLLEPLVDRCTPACEQRQGPGAHLELAGHVVVRLEEVDHQPIRRPLEVGAVPAALVRQPQQLENGDQLGGRARRDLLVELAEVFGGEHRTLAGRQRGDHRAQVARVARDAMKGLAVGHHALDRGAGELGLAALFPDGARLGAVGVGGDQRSADCTFDPVELELRNRDREQHGAGEQDVPASGARAPLVQVAGLGQLFHGLGSYGKTRGLASAVGARTDGGAGRGFSGCPCISRPRRRPPPRRPTRWSRRPARKGRCRRNRCCGCAR